MPDATPCSLCELAIGRRTVMRNFDGVELPFCCMGCANVYSILLESGAIQSGQNLRETEIFRRSRELGLISQLDDESTNPALPTMDPSLPTLEAVYKIGGMWCSACGWLIEHSLSKLPGVISADVFFASDMAKVRYCPQYLPPDRIPARIEQLGYRATEYGDDDQQAKSETRALMLRLGVAAFLWANIMAFSTILYVGYFEQISATASRVLPYILWVLATPLVFYCAHPILRTAFLGARNLQIRMETLLAVGILTAYLLSVGQTVTGHTHVYFDTAAAIVTLVLAGKLIERGAKNRAARSIANLYRMMPSKVRIEGPSGERFVAVEAVEPGTVFLVKSGERIPADGIVLDGETDTDESLLTGESAPIAKKPGDTVVSGSLNAGNVIRVRALRSCDTSSLAQIIRMVERALASRAPIQRTADRIAQVFVPIVVVVAIAVFAWLSFSGLGVGFALMRATTILVIACPCALGLATPLAITAAVGSASRQGILVADSSVLETMTGVDVVLLDKTGTVTHGDFRLTEFLLLEEGNFEDEWLALLAGVERFSEHLLGRAITRRAAQLGIEPEAVSAVEIHKGSGITAEWEGGALFVGNRSLAVRQCGHLREAVLHQAALWQEQGCTVSYFGVDSRVCGLLAFGDTIKPGAAAMVERLKHRGIAVKLVSGDAPLSTAAVARQVGIDDFTAEATPEGKAEIVRQLQGAGPRVAILGDGVNDAPAIAAADLGIAMGTGAEIAMSAAPIVLVSGALAKVDEAFGLAKATTRVVRQNLFWAFFYNIAGITLAITGVLSPIFAAAAMLLSSTSVVANSMRLTRALQEEKH